MLNFSVFRNYSKSLSRSESTEFDTNENKENSYIKELDDKPASVDNIKDDSACNKVIKRTANTAPTEIYDKNHSNNVSSDDDWKIEGPHTSSKEFERDQGFYTEYVPRSLRLFKSLSASTLASRFSESSSDPSVEEQLIRFKDARELYGCQTVSEFSNSQNDVPIAKTLPYPLEDSSSSGFSGESDSAESVTAADLDPDPNFRFDYGDTTSVPGTQKSSLTKSNTPAVITPFPNNKSPAVKTVLKEKSPNIPTLKKESAFTERQNASPVIKKSINNVVLKANTQITVPKNKPFVYSDKDPQKVAPPKISKGILKKPSVAIKTCQTKDNQSKAEEKKVFEKNKTKTNTLSKDIEKKKIQGKEILKKDIAENILNRSLPLDKEEVPSEETRVSVSTRHTTYTKKAVEELNVLVYLDEIKAVLRKIQNVTDINEIYLLQQESARLLEFIQNNQQAIKCYRFATEFSKDFSTSSPEEIVSQISLEDYRVGEDNNISRIESFIDDYKLVDLIDKVQIEMGRLKRENSLQVNELNEKLNRLEVKYNKLKKMTNKSRNECKQNTMILKYFKNGYLNLFKFVLLPAIINNNTTTSNKKIVIEINSLINQLSHKIIEVNNDNSENCEIQTKEKLNRIEKLNLKFKDFLLL